MILNEILFQVPCASHLLANKPANLSLSHSLNRLKRWLPEDIFKSPHDELNFWHPNNSRHPLNPPFDLNTPYNQGDDDNVLVFTSNKTLTDLTNVIFRHVNKRAIVDPKKTTCMLYLQADHQFFQKYGTEEACIEVMTRHVQRVNSIYKTTGIIFRYSNQLLPLLLGLVLRIMRYHSEINCYHGDYCHSKRFRLWLKSSSVT